MIARGLDQVFRALQRAEIDLAARDQALRLAWEFWAVVKEVSTEAPNRELLRKLDEAERRFLDALDVMGWDRPARGRVFVERIEK